jgi:predicted Rdx family selenoprotein
VFVALGQPLRRNERVGHRLPLMYCCMACTADSVSSWCTCPEMMSAIAHDQGARVLEPGDIGAVAIVASGVMVEAVPFGCLSSGP